jgi:hypothetical protein
MTAGALEPAVAERPSPLRAPRATRALLRFVAEWSVRRARSRLGPSLAHLNTIVDCFMSGYRTALDVPSIAELEVRLNVVEPDVRGFAYEGASMALGLIDAIAPARPARLRAFVEGPARPHVYMAHVGAGWAAARLRRSPSALSVALDPVIGWLAVDGYGFHEAYFHTDRVVRQHALPRGARGHAASVLDQGIGRALWFVDNADVHRIGATVRRFPARRRADLWSGVGLAATYAGGVPDDDLRSLVALAGGYEPQLAQGAAFAAEARARAGNPSPHTGAACAIFTGLSADDASALVRRCRADLVDTPSVPAYELWRRRVAAGITAAGPVSIRPSVAERA